MQASLYFSTVEKQDIVIIGAGNVAHHLGHELSKAGHFIVQIYSKTDKSASGLAKALNTAYTTDINKINKSASFYLIAIRDDHISEVASQLNLVGKIVAHTSATVPMDVLKPASNYYGVFYPLQTLTTNRAVDFRSVPVCIEASSEPVKKKLTDIANTISKNVHYLDGEKRKALHVAAVFVNNFTNRLYHIAYEIAKSEDLDFELLKPLIKETVNKLENTIPEALQTGPASRNDLKTIEEHLYYLMDNPDFKEVYLILTESIMQANKEKSTPYE